MVGKLTMKYKASIFFATLVIVLSFFLTLNLEAGWNWNYTILRPTTVAVEDSTGSTYNYGDYTNTNAFFWSSIDISAYAGTDLGYTPYKIRLVDAAGKQATGYLAAVGAGETLGADLLSGWDLTVGWNKKIDTTINDSNTFTVGASNQGWVYKDPLLTVNGLFKGAYNGTPSAGTSHWINNGYGSPIYILDGETDKYFTCVIDNYWLIYYLAASGNTLDVITQTVQRVTDPPATGVHIVSSLNGVTRAWENIEAGFKPNTIASWVIYGDI